MWECEKWDWNAGAEIQRGNVGNLGGNTKNVGNQGSDARNQSEKLK